MSSKPAIAIAFLTIALAAGPVGAEESGPISSEAAFAAMSDAELSERTSFLLDRLEAGKRNARIYQYGFTGAWTLGIGIGVVRAATTSHSDDRVNGIVTASKGAVGVARLTFSAAPGRLGADGIRSLPDRDRSDRIAKLRAAETRLASAKKYVDRRKQWFPHLANLALNGTGAGITAGLGDETDALVGGLVGVAAGELLIWLRPWRSIADVDDYEKRFSGALPSAPGVSWNIVPTAGGAMVQVRY